MNYQTFSKLQLKPLLGNSFHCFHIDLRETGSEKTVSIGIARLVLMLGKRPICICNEKKTLQENSFRTSRDSVL